MAKPGAAEDSPWEDHIAWKVGGKMFALSGEDSKHVMLKATKERQEQLIMMPHIIMAPYLGHHGWISMEVIDDEAWDLCQELVDDSYDLVVAKLPKKLRP